MELNPCQCGATTFGWAPSRATRDGGRTVATYDGDCPDCESRRSFCFTLPEKPVTPPAFGGDEPSSLIEPHTFLALSRRATRLAAADPYTLPVVTAELTLSLIAIAVAALEEVLKFIPPHADAVPVEAFVSSAGRTTLELAPQDYQRATLAARLATLEELSERYRNRLSPSATQHQ
jgi:hypothetical protein